MSYYIGFKYTIQKHNGYDNKYECENMHYRAVLALVAFHVVEKEDDYGYNHTGYD